MKTVSITLLLAGLIGGASIAAAQSASEHASHHAAQSASEHASHHGHHAAADAPASADLTDGEIRKVDKAAGKLTIKHGLIKNLDMPGMTMVFQVRDAALLDKVQAGDKVRFRAENEGGKILVTEIQQVK